MPRRSLRALGAAALAIAGAAAPSWSAHCCAVGRETAACALERERARRTAARIERDWPLRGSSPETDLIRKVGRRLAATARPRTGPWTFTTVHDRRANAFSIGGGRVYVTDGSIRALRTEAELAALIAHEMGHDLAGHFCDGEMSRAEPAGPPVVGEISPALEAEADRLSLDVLAAAGYDPHAALEVAKLALPGTKSRSDDGRVRALARTLDGRPAGGQRNSEEFKRLKRSLAGPRE